MNPYTNKVGLIAKHKIKRIYEIALEELDCHELVGVCVSFVSEEEIRELNNKHRNVDRVTDVLSFPMLEIKPGDDIKDFREEQEEIFLGDIVICTKRAKEQAKEYGHSYNRELCFLALHGLLHLLGYDHMTEVDEKEMMGLAERILERAKVRRK